MSVFTAHCILEGDPFRQGYYEGLEAETLLRDHRFSLIRGLHIANVFETALFGKVLSNNYCTLFLVSKKGENYSGTQHQHLSYLDANFQAYKDKLGVEGFYIAPIDESRVSLIETRLPLWERRGYAPYSGEPLFVREV